MPESTAAVIESQPDWLTCSAHGQDAARNMADWCTLATAQEQREGNRRRPFRLMGYEGERCGRVEWGQRDDASCLLRLIGDAARLYLSDALSLADTVTRIDLAVTWRADPADPHIGRNTYAMASMFHQSHPKSALPSRVEDAAGGTTVYLGRRESENFLRVYNKEQECIAKDDRQGIDRYRACWRYELEVKGPLSQAMAAVVADHPTPATYIQNYLYSYCEAHGIAPAFLADGSQRLLPGFRRRSDADSRLKHIARNVRPTANWLRAAGREDDLREALGFDPTGESLRELEWLLRSDPGRV